MARTRRDSRLPAPFLKRVWLDPARIEDSDAYPFCLPVFRSGDFELAFERPITIIVGENGSGKSTLLEGIAALAGYDQAGGGKGYRPVDHSRSIEATAEPLGRALRASWLPKVTEGWFFRAESFFSVARYLDLAAQEPQSGPPPDYLSHSHGEGFLRFFEERCQRRGIYIFDEPESALSPARQIEFLKLLRRMEQSGDAQVLIATHAPLLMAYPEAELLQLGKCGLARARLEELDHFRLMREFFSDPATFVATMLEM
ncbi:MAG TPA: AAA family ATPase [Beijerinckiaceae bacterium]|nr:AAA family ATPase [Methylobacteriaceae bacterium]HPG02118.1 AAA family ATPase [Rhodoblastus sp.]HRY04697.1 AAA family ATPase [Beijerinckiaceae bacterium]